MAGRVRAVQTRRTHFPFVVPEAYQRQMIEEISCVSAPINARVVVPGGRSVTNRALFAAALSDGRSVVSNVLVSEDTTVFVAALQELGFSVVLDKQALTCTVVGAAGGVPNTRARVWTENAGTAARFLLALCAASAGEYEFDGTPQIRRRPIGPLVDALSALGAEFDPPSPRHLPFRVRGRVLRGGSLEPIGADTSSQFTSALLLASPLASAAISVRLAGVISRPFVTMTTSIMSRFGIQVDERDGVLTVPAPQRYRPCDYFVEPDASSCSYFFAAAAVTGGRVEVPNVDRARSVQGDFRFLEVLEKMGCRVQTQSGTTIVEGPTLLRGLEASMTDISDTFMTLACVAPFADAPVTITGIGHTRHQESDRIAAICEGLQRLGVGVESGADWVRVTPATPRGALVDSHDDHRIAMSLALVGLRVPGVRVEQAECVRKTLPGYFGMLRSATETNA